MNLDIITVQPVICDDYKILVDQSTDTEEDKKKELDEQSLCADLCDLCFTCFCFLFYFFFILFFIFYKNY